MADTNPADAQLAYEDSTNSDRPIAESGGLLWRVKGVVRTIRPHQWVKNVFVLAPVVFAKDFFRLDLLIEASTAFATFCLLAGAVYTINDLVDVQADRAHPVKRFRPIASGQVSVVTAKWLAGALVVISLSAAAWLSWGFFVVAASYFGMNLAYSFRLKKIAYLDVAIIATGFVLRVVAGGFATGIHVSWYLLACTALLALFLGFGKRRHELAQAMRDGGKTRSSLLAYKPHALTSALAVTGTATVAVYIAYTLDPATRAFFRSDWLWLTTPFTIVGVGRFLHLVAGRPKAESPTQEMLRDTPFVLNLIVWAIVVFVIVYRLRPGVGS